MLAIKQSHAMEPRHLNLILNQFSPLKRRYLLTWLFESSAQRRAPYHRAFLSTLSQVSRYAYLKEILDLKTKIAFSLLHEFGLRFSEKRVYMTLIDEVDTRIRTQEAS